MIALESPGTAVPGLSGLISGHRQLTVQRDIPMNHRTKSENTSDFKWFHVILTTYGAWPPGDRRGFRTRHHREHVDGDYKRPPPTERYRAREIWSRSLLKQPPVVIPEKLRPAVGEFIREKLDRCGAGVVCIAVAGQHAHILAKMPKKQVRHWIGMAKRHATFELKQLSWKGKVWGLRCKVVPIENRRQQLNVFAYIVRHRKEGAWVWAWKSPTK
jgi:hypothetical protein